MYRSLARVVSFALHPFVMPLYMILLLLTDTTYASIYSLKVKIYLVWVTVLFTMIIPALVLMLLKSYHKIRDSDLTRRSERLIPVSAIAVCYLLCGVAVIRVPLAEMLSRFMFAAAACALLVMIISLFWKISLHLTASGAILSFVLMVHIASGGRLMGALCAAIFAAGLLGSARLQLGCHTPMQVFAGFMTGLVVGAVIVLL